MKVKVTTTVVTTTIEEFEYDDVDSVEEAESLADEEMFDRYGYEDLDVEWTHSCEVVDE